MGLGRSARELLQVGVTFARPLRDLRATSARPWGRPRIARRSRGSRAEVARTSRRLEKFWHTLPMSTYRPFRAFPPSAIMNPSWDTQAAVITTYFQRQI